MKGRSNKTTFKPGHYVLVACDNINKLRKCDIYDLLDQCEGRYRPRLAQYIMNMRPDYKDEVEACLKDIQAENAAP